MKISEQWLRSWVDPPLDLEHIVERLTMTGTKVEGVEPVAPPFTGVVVADVRAVARHPDADKLSVCRVFDGSDELTIVCGAANVRAGMKAALARVGARLPGDVSIEKTRLRGVDSAGMLCSARELGLGDDASGIIELAATAKVGADVRAALALDDHAIELDLTPNRGDCLSVRGVARELAVLTGAPTTVPDCTPVAAAIGDRFPVRLDDAVGCPRYLGRVVRGVDVTRPTPEWIAQRLVRSGLRPIDCVVDVTNYVMLELGQPLHAFDLAVLDGEVVVRRARPGERLELLDGREAPLDPTTLLITDRKGPIAMAGVMGGARSAIGAQTRDVFIECAFFAPLALAGTARRYGMQTDASQRYERGVDPQLQPAAMERATRLLIEIAGGAPGPVVDTVSEPNMPRRRGVTLRKARLDKFVGERHEPAEALRILTALGFTTRESARDEAWHFDVPSHRFDVEREVDLIEEICRIRGYDRVPLAQPQALIPLRRVARAETPQARLRALLVDLGYHELVTYSFVDPALQDLLDPGAKTISLANPMSQEQSVMRTNLLPGLVKALAANLARQQDRARLFEVGRVFAATHAKGLPAQPLYVGGLVHGTRWPESWSSRRDEVDFFDVKGDVERLLALAGHDDATFELAEDSVLHPGQRAKIVSGGHAIGRIGRLHPEIEHRLDLKRATFVFELQIDALTQRALRSHETVSRFPSVRRDLALLVDRNVPAAAVERCVRSAAGPALVDFRLFDVYQGEGIDSAKKSMAVGLTFQDPSRTLVDADINARVDAVVGALERDLGARLR